MNLLHFDRLCGQKGGRSNRIVRTVKPIYGYTDEGKSPYLFNNRDEFAGLYAISVSDVSNEQSVVYSKMGLSNSLVSRQSQYHLCFPQGTWLLCLAFLTKTAMDMGDAWVKTFLTLRIPRIR